MPASSLSRQSGSGAGGAERGVDERPRSSARRPPGSTPACRRSARRRRCATCARRARRRRSSCPCSPARPTHATIARSRRSRWRSSTSSGGSVWRPVGISSVSSILIDSTRFTVAKYGYVLARVPSAYSTVAKLGAAHRRSTTRGRRGGRVYQGAANAKQDVPVRARRRAAGAGRERGQASANLSVHVLSDRADLISGGEALVVGHPAAKRQPRVGDGDAERRAT